MRPVVFYLVTLVSLLYVAVMIAQAYEYNGWDMAVTDQHNLQPKVLRAQQVNQLAQQLVRRVAADSVHDPALVEVLKKNGLKVTFTGTQDVVKSNVDTNPASPETSTNPAPAPGSN